MGKLVAPEDNPPKVGKQRKLKMTIIYKKVQIKVRMTNSNLKIDKINETSGYFE